MHDAKEARKERDKWTALLLTHPPTNTHPGTSRAPHKNTIIEVVRLLCVWSANKQLSGPGKEDYFNLVMAKVVWPIEVG